MSSETQPPTMRPLETGGSGTRQAAFLRPLPGDRRDAPSHDPHARPGDDVLDRLFPLTESADDHEAARGSAVGVRLGHFIIEERIGRGGMGGVFRAVDERLNRVVALKVLAPSSARDSLAVDRFRNEGQAAARLDHENIARVYYIGDDQGVPFIAFEFVRGTNVRDFILQKGMLSPEEAVNYALQIAQALRHTQAARVVHRDIKPSNIIITPSGHAKLVDLGLARQEQTDPARELTVPGTTLGTFDYIAPEQARDPRCVDVRADIYSLGCTLYHMLTGQPPFPQGTIIQKVVDHHRDAPPDPALRNPHVPPALSQIVRTMMASNPDDRYAGPDALIADLSHVAAALGLRPTHADNLIWTRPLYDRQPGFFETNKSWLLTLTVLLLIAAVIYQWPDGQPSAGGLGSAAVGPQPDSSAAASTADGASDTAAVTAPAEPGLAPSAPEPAEPAGMRNGLAALRLPAAPAEVPDPVTERAPRAPLTSELADDPPRATTPLRELADDPVVQDIDQLNSPIPFRRAPLTGNRKDASAAPAQPFVVLDPRSQIAQGYATLDEACRIAPSDTVIELRFDGSLSMAPVRLNNKRLTIRAQLGRRPVIEFVSRTDQSPGAATRMFQVSGGGLVLQDVELRMPVLSGRSDRWALFSLVEARELRLERVSVVVTNPDRQPAAVVEFALPPGDDADAMMPGSMQREQLILDWHNCWVRAECDLLYSQTLDPAELDINNVALGVRGCLARIAGQPLANGRVIEDRRLSIQLQHVTALLYDGLIRVDTGADTDRDFAPIRLECDHTALVVRPQQPLVVMRGQQPLSTLQARLRSQSRRSAIDLTGPIWEIIQPLEGLPTRLGAAEFDLTGQSIVELDLLQQPLRWNEAAFASLSENAFLLRPPPAGSSRDALTGVQFGDPMPSADVFTAANGSRGNVIAP